ncbi:PAS domain-containing protein [Streptomyces cavernicola]|uniref:PAS domain-containing protein n=1 Tax=Streptomyces cavernicola TaxID=3043613 RepID=A0ABT6SBS8_9ACTN|nr:PAS domain-containing protein [Streptomyces sp. B-S-A6]MDI3405643.1 PAS domain-containing protein [Streptomyces sp. B-S-A6]
MAMARAEHQLCAGIDDSGIRAPGGTEVVARGRTQRLRQCLDSFGIVVSAMEAVVQREPECGRAIVVADVHGVITQWNGGCQRLFGYPAAQAVGSTLDLIVPEHLRETHWAGFHRAMREPQVKDLAADLPVLCADGEVRSFAGRLLVLSDGLGVAFGAVAIYTDQGTTGVTPFG